MTSLNTERRDSFEYRLRRRNRWALIVAAIIAVPLVPGTIMFISTSGGWVIGIGIVVILLVACVFSPWYGTIQHMPAIRADRELNGECRKCGYDLKATPRELPCPECGTPRAPASSKD